jgi:hypothetical protein
VALPHELVRNAYFPATPSTALRWDPYGGRWSAEGSADHPWFAGYDLDEYTERPVLVWSVGEAFDFEGEFEEHWYGTVAVTTVPPPGGPAIVWHPPARSPSGPG